MAWNEDFIEIDSACRNQQCNFDEVENTARPFLLSFLALWLNLCNNSDQTLFSNILTFARSLGSCGKPRPSASVFNISLGTWQTLMHEKPCKLDPYIEQICARLIHWATGAQYCEGNAFKNHLNLFKKNNIRITI